MIQATVKVAAIERARKLQQNKGSWNIQTK